jgi:hypothetical protein
LYQYDPKLIEDPIPDPFGVNDLGEEPEGIDWWNRDNVPSRYPGQLHALLLDNAAGDDQIWLKHYRVDYFCMAGADSDGDGDTDHDEVYLHNTHPLLGDSDDDGIDDVLDNCRFTNNPDQADQDDDEAGDACDADQDGDGQTNNDETACGSSPVDAGSVSPDLDGDREPDCVDDDDDADGQSDADEAACGSDPRDAEQPDCLDSDDDNDGVSDGDDRCPGTLVPDPIIPKTGELGNKRYALVDDDLVFDQDTAGGMAASSYSTLETGGCNASQIAAAFRLGKSHWDHGLSRGVLNAWSRGLQR